MLHVLLNRQTQIGATEPKIAPPFARTAGYFFLAAERLTELRSQRHNEAAGPGRLAMSDKETVEKLRDELKRVTDERDRLRKTVLQLMAEQMPMKSEEEVRQEIEDIRKNPIPFEQIVEELRIRLGNAP